MLSKILCINRHPTFPYLVLINITAQAETLYRLELVNPPMIDSEQITSLVHTGNTHPAHIIYEKQVLSHFNANGIGTAMSTVAHLGFILTVSRALSGYKMAVWAGATLVYHSDHSSTSSINTDVS